eukprot:TRINITY_DN106114_c0_g1_i1.p1 TRINITY_DN106114_c0_g1~~TRINITY_DN106114_c0_g1_i1.p1  ORF type:complete len:493 (+),score=131.50 TRINITY_DN106114_c0_g1_i1:78-1556(+)
MGFTVEYDEDVVAELIERIQVYCLPRRIRVKEFFNDFDPLRHGRCTVINFGRALNMIGLSLTDDEVDMLTQHFTQEGPEVVQPQVINYNAFCAAIDEVYVAGSPAALQMSSDPSSTQLMTFKPKSLEEEEQFMHVLHRLAAMCKARGVLFKGIYFEVDRAPIPSPSRQSPYMGGKVTKQQFIQRFPFKKEFSPEDVELLANHYLTEKGDVHFMAMHNDISEVTDHEAPPFPTSPLYLKPDHSTWSQSRHSVVDKIRSKVVEKRVRLVDYFRDFDPLRKGYVTSSQVKTVMTICNIATILDGNDYDQLVAMFQREDGLWCYADFVAEVEKEFVTPNLEKDPLAQTSMPDATSTMISRRNKVCLSPEQLARWEWLEGKIRSRVTKLRVNLVPSFEDMDKTHCGHITKNQFYRVMESMGFNLSAEDVDLLGLVYCDLGTHIDFNYKDFLKSVDVPSEDVELAIAQLAAPYQGFEPAQYFSPQGKVLKCARSDFLS